MSSVEASGDHLPYKYKDAPPPNWGNIQPMTGSHIPGVDTGARGGMTTFMSGGGLQTISSGMGSFGGGAGPAGGFAGGDRQGEPPGLRGSSEGAGSQQAVDAYSAHTGQEYNVFGLGQSGQTGAAAGGGNPYYYAGSIGDLTRGVTYDTNGFAVEGGNNLPRPPSSATSWATLTPSQMKDLQSIEGGAPWLAPGEWSSSTFQAYVSSNGDLNVLANPVYGPDGQRETIGGQPLGDLPGSTVTPTPREIAEANGASGSWLTRTDAALAGFNGIVNDELVDQGTQDLRDGNRAGFIRNGVKYSFYNTFMPSSVEGAAAGIAGGAVAGKALGVIAKGATELWPVLGQGIGRTAVDTVTWNPYTDPGPLGTKIATTFRGASYTETTTPKTTTFYRVWGGSAHEIGPYWTRTRPAGPLQSVIDNALDPAWGNTAVNVVRIDVPPGTKIYEGTSAPQGALLGGGNQVFIPRVDRSWIVK